MATEDVQAPQKEIPAKYQLMDAALNAGAEQSIMQTDAGLTGGALYTLIGGAVVALAGWASGKFSPFKGFVLGAVAVGGALMAKSTLTVSAASNDGEYYKKRQPGEFDETKADIVHRLLDRPTTEELAELKRMQENPPERCVTASSGRTR